MAGESAEDKRVWMAEALQIMVGGQAAASGHTASGQMAAMAPADPNSSLSRAASKPELWDGKMGAAFSAPSGATPSIAAATPVGAKTVCVSPKGRKVEIVQGPDGRVALTKPRPPIAEITFSGGGGKGAALPGAVTALEQSGIMKNCKTLRGASVGSATAAILSAGVSAEEFGDLAEQLGPIVQSESAIPVHMKGAGLENFIRSSMSKSLQKKISACLAKSDSAEDGAGLDDRTISMLKALQVKFAKGDGVTFGDLRTLSKIIPDVKELAISGTMIGDDSGAPGKIEKGKPQLAMFSADTEPDLDVATAVHASAALPPVFKPVDIKLSSGVTARFEDGGVMNNAPTSAQTGADRQVDPEPATGGMTFIFENEDSRDVTQGKATPRSGKLFDFIAGAPLAASEYAKNRALADKPEDVVVVPLVADGPWYKPTDFTGLVGLLDFNMRSSAKASLQAKSQQATQARLDNRKQPETRDYASAGEMLNAVGRDDLEAMAAGNFPGAREALAFRDSVKDGVAALEAVAAGAKKASFAAGPVKDALAKLSALAGDDKDRQAYIAREMNRSGRLDPLLDVAKTSGVAVAGVLKAGVAVSEALAAHAHAQTILREVIYPKMVRESPDGVGGTVLRQVDDLLRRAMTAGDVNRALGIAIAHFANKSDVTGRHHHHEFAAELKSYLMK